MIKLIENSVSVGEGQGNVHLFSNQGEMAAEQKQTHAAPLQPTFCCSYWPVKYILQSGGVKHSDISHPQGAEPLDVIFMWSCATTRHDAQIRSRRSSSSSSEYICSFEQLYCTFLSDTSGHEPESAAGLALESDAIDINKCTL